MKIIDKPKSVHESDSPLELDYDNFLSPLCECEVSKSM